MKITIKTTDKLERIDKLIAEKFPKLSRSFIQKEIKKGNILVNKKEINPRYKVLVGDIVDIKNIDQPKPDISPNNKVKFKIIEEDKNFIVIDKPAGLITHPSDSVHEPTLVNGLLAKFPEIEKVGEDKLRPGIVHRLDRDVSGLMVIAREQKMFEYLKKQFQERTITKQYIALVHGLVTEEEEGVIDTPIGRSVSKSGKMAAHTEEFDGDKQAKTEYKVIERIKNYTLILATIHTGRTHQIRVHLNSIEHPVVGDTLYTNKRINTKHAASLGRLFLHATILGFNDLSDKKKEYESKLPKDLKDFLKTL
jgi:23S rRNA pseudouridine1911/1915/1917 synthase